VLYGDTPFIGADTLKAMIARREAGAGVVVLGFRPDDPGAYGRLIVDESGRLQRIVEFRDANEAECAVRLCNSGVMAIDAAILFRLIDAVDDDNAKGEFYLTDIVGLARGDNIDCAVVEADAAELQGVNSRADLAEAEPADEKRPATIINLAVAEPISDITERTEPEATLLPESKIAKVVASKDVTPAGESSDEPKVDTTKSTVITVDTSGKSKLGEDAPRKGWWQRL